MDYGNKFLGQRNSKMTVRRIINASWDNLVKLQHAGWAYRLWALSFETEIHDAIFQRINAITFLLRSFSSF